MLLDYLNWTPTYRQGLPVLPGALPFIGHTPLINRYSHDLFKRARDALGPIYAINMGFGRWGVVCEGRPGLDLLRSRDVSSELPRRMVPLLVGVSLISQDGAVHAHMRSAMNESFQPRGLGQARIGELTQEIIERHIDSWLHLPQISLMSEIRKLALEIIFRIIGIEPQDLALWEKWYREFLYGALPIPIALPGFPMWRGQRARAWLTERFLSILATARQADTRRGLLGSLVHGRDDQGQQLTDEELIDNLLFLVLAGHETIASALTSLALVLTQHPDWLGRLQAEAESAGPRPRSHAELARAPIAEALFRETVRLYAPIFMLTRELTQEQTLHGHRLPAGTAVGVPLGRLARDAEHFPEPERFQPERWLRERQAASPIETCAFGIGPHFCLGYPLALLEAVQFAQTWALGLARHRLRVQPLHPQPLAIRYAPFAQPPPKLRVALTRLP